MERVVEALARASNGRDKVICVDRVGPCAEALDEGQVFCLEAHRGFGGLDFKALWRLVRHVREERFTILHSHNMVARQIAGMASLLTRAVNVHTKHGAEPPRNRTAAFCHRWRAKPSRAIVAVSEDVKRVLIDLEGVPPEKVVVIRNGIDVEAFAPRDPARRSAARLSLGVPENGFVVGAVGRLAAVKGYDVLLRAFAEVRRDVPTAFLAFVGDGPERSALERLCAELGASGSVLFVGATSQVRPWYDVMDCFVLSSLSEGTSLALLEAGAAGLPAVVTDVGGNGEVVADGETGLLAPVGDHHALARGLTTLGRDRELRASMGRSARQRITERYSVRSMVRQYETVYARAVGAPTPPPPASRG